MLNWPRHPDQPSFHTLGLSPAYFKAPLAPPCPCLDQEKAHLHYSLLSPLLFQLTPAKAPSVTPTTPSPGALPCALGAQEHFQSPRAGAVTPTALSACAQLCTYRPDLTLCFQLLQDKLRIPTCDILHSVYTGLTEKILFLIQNTEKVLLGCPFPGQNRMTDFCSVAPRLRTNAKTKLLIPKKVSFKLP